MSKGSLSSVELENGRMKRAKRVRMRVIMLNIYKYNAGAYRHIDLVSSKAFTHTDRGGVHQKPQHFTGVE